MKKLIRLAMNLIGEKYRHKLYRSMATIPAEYLDPEFSVEVARTREDLEAAYKLLHDCYVGINIIDPQPSGLRCYLFSFLPTSTIIVAKKGNKVIGTMSAIKDSKSGLPSDKDFLAQNNQFRRAEKVLIEASALAVAPEFRGHHSVSFLLMKYLYFYCKNSVEGDHIIAAVHPRAEDFYKALWSFERNGDVVQYKSLKGAAAIHISLELSEAHLNKIRRNYTSKNLLKNIPAAMEIEDSRFHYPLQKEGQNIHPVITPEMLEYFCLQKEEVWERMSASEKETLIQVYTTYFGSESMTVFRERLGSRVRELAYRTPLRLSAIVDVESNTGFCEILDINDGGCFISSGGALPHVGQKISISFRFEGNSYKVQARVAWINDGRTLLRKKGYGVRFDKPLSALSFQLKQWLYEEHEEPPAAAPQKLA